MPDPTQWHELVNIFAGSGEAKDSTPGQIPSKEEVLAPRWTRAYWNVREKPPFQAMFTWTYVMGNTTTTHGSYNSGTTTTTDPVTGTAGLSLLEGDQDPNSGGTPWWRYNMGSYMTIAALDGDGTETTSPRSFDRAREQLTAAIAYYQKWEPNLNTWQNNLQQDGWQGLAASGFGDIINRIFTAYQNILETTSGDGVSGGYLTAVNDAQQALWNARNAMRTAFDTWKTDESSTPQGALRVYARGLTVDADPLGRRPAVLLHGGVPLGQIDQSSTWDAVEQAIKNAWRQTAETYLDYPVVGIVSALTAAYQRSTTDLRELNNVIRTALSGSPDSDSNTDNDQTNKNQEDLNKILEDLRNNNGGGDGGGGGGEGGNGGPDTDDVNIPPPGGTDGDGSGGTDGTGGDGSGGTDEVNIPSSGGTDGGSGLPDEVDIPSSGSTDSTGGGGPQTLTDVNIPSSGSTDGGTGDGTGGGTVGGTGGGLDLQPSGQTGITDGSGNTAPPFGVSNIALPGETGGGTDGTGTTGTTGSPGGTDLDGLPEFSTTNPSGGSDNIPPVGVTPGFTGSTGITGSSVNGTGRPDDGTGSVPPSGSTEIPSLNDFEESTGLPGDQLVVPPAGSTDEFPSITAPPSGITDSGSNISVPGTNDSGGSTIPVPGTNDNSSGLPLPGSSDGSDLLPTTGSTLDPSFPSLSGPSLSDQGFPSTSSTDFGDPGSTNGSSGYYGDSGGGYGSYGSDGSYVDSGSGFDYTQPSLSSDGVDDGFWDPYSSGTQSTLTSSGVDSTGDSTSAPASAQSPMMPPMMGGMGGMGAGGGGERNQERERTTWLAEDTAVWGTDPELAPTVVGRTPQQHVPAGGNREQQPVPGAPGRGPVATGRGPRTGRPGTGSAQGGQRDGNVQGSPGQRNG
ncbi:hypothetical protein [Streptomyces sp. NPDC000878]